MRNTAIVTVSVVAISAVISVLAGYAIALAKPPGARWVLYAAVFGFMLPVEALIVPWYYQFRSVGIINTYWAMILPQVAQSIACLALGPSAFGLRACGSRKETASAAMHSVERRSRTRYEGGGTSRRSYEYVGMVIEVEDRARHRMLNVDMCVLKRSIIEHTAMTWNL